MRHYMSNAGRCSLACSEVEGICMGYFAGRRWMLRGMRHVVIPCEILVGQYAGWCMHMSESGRCSMRSVSQIVEGFGEPVSE